MSTVEEAFAKASEDLENTDESTDETQVEEVDESVEEEESTQEVEQDQAGDDDESFTSVNPDDLPEDLQKVYKSLQGDYTRKTQEAAKIRKESEKRVKELESRLRELEESRTQQYQPQQPKTQEEHLRELIRREQEQTQLESFEQEALSYYRNADPRLNDESDSFDEQTHYVVGQMMDKKLSEYVNENGSELGFNYKDALKESLEAWDGYIESITKKRVEEHTRAAKARQAKVAKQNPKTSKGKATTKVASIEDALELALQQS